MTSISTSRHPVDEGSPHIEVSVFVGPDPEHRALAGVLRFRRGEDDEFIRRVEDIYQKRVTKINGGDLDGEEVTIPPDVFALIMIRQEGDEYRASYDERGHPNRLSIAQTLTSLVEQILAALIEDGHE